MSQCHSVSELATATRKIWNRTEHRKINRTIEGSSPTPSKVGSPSNYHLSDKPFFYSQSHIHTNTLKNKGKKNVHICTLSCC